MDKDAARVDLEDFLESFFLGNNEHGKPMYDCSICLYCKHYDPTSDNDTCPDCFCICSFAYEPRKERFARHSKLRNEMT